MGDTTEGPEGGLCLLTFGMIVCGGGGSLAVTAGVTLVDGLLICGDSVAFENVVLHGLDFAADFGMDVCSETESAVGYAELALLAVDGLPLAGVCEEDPFGTAFGTVLVAILGVGYLD